jgi:hypothetical protein
MSRHVTTKLNTNIDPAAPLPRFLYNIPSLCDTHPDLPDNVGIYLGRAIVAGNPVDSQHLAHTRGVAKCLRALSGGIPIQIRSRCAKLSYTDSGDSKLITKAIVDSAKLRAKGSGSCTWYGICSLY